MTIGLSTGVRNAMADALTARVGGAAKLRIYSGTRPATGGAATTLLAELTCGTPFAPAASGGVVTLNAVTQDSAADATGTATWARLLTSASVAEIDLTVSVTGGAGEVQLSSTSITAGGPVQVTSASFTMPNA